MRMLAALIERRQVMMLPRLRRLEQRQPVRLEIAGPARYFTGRYPHGVGSEIRGGNGNMDVGIGMTAAVISPVRAGAAEHAEGQLANMPAYGYVLKIVLGQPQLSSLRPVW